MSLNLWISILDKWSSIFVDENCLFLFSWLQFSFLSVIIALKPRPKKTIIIKIIIIVTITIICRGFCRPSHLIMVLGKLLILLLMSGPFTKPASPGMNSRLNLFLKQFIVRLIAFKNSEPRVKNKRLNDLGRFQKTDGPHTCQVVSGRAKPSVPLTV